MFDFITDLDDGKKKIDFSDRPILVDDVESHELFMREPTVADQFAVDSIKSDGRREVALIANLCEVSPETIQALKMSQYGRLQDAYSAFMA